MDFFFTSQIELLPRKLFKGGKSSRKGTSDRAVARSESLGGGGCAK